MGQFAEQHLPCKHCGSSDAYAVYHSGVGICFSCGAKDAPEGQEVSPSAKSAKSPLITGLEYKSLPVRKISEDTCRRYGYGISGGVQVAPYYDNKGRLVAQKVRAADKTFHITGDAKSIGLFGSQLCRPSGRMIVVTEGEIDALSVAEALKTWPVVSLPNGAGGARDAIRKNLELLEGYAKVVLAFDNDEAGQQAVEDVLDLFSPGKVHIMDYGSFKDANEMLVSKGPDAVREAVWGAKQWRPDGVLNLADIRDRVKQRPQMGNRYPWAGLNDKLYGFRNGELTTWTAGTGVGKTAIVSELVYHLGMVGEKRVGMIYLEEGIDRAGQRLVGLHVNKPLHLPGNELSDEEFNAAFDATLGTRRFVAYDHFGSVDAGLLLNRIRYMFLVDMCDVVVLDHVSLVVSGAELDDDERRLLDYIVTKLKTLAVELNKPIHIVSHLKRKEGKAHEEGAHVSLGHLRGTQAIAQLSDTVIAAERDQQADNQVDRNTTNLVVLKNRYAGVTGQACSLVYDPATGRLQEKGVFDDEAF